MRILFLWTDISGYMAACWRELAGRTGVTLRVATHDSSAATAFDRRLMEGIDWLPLDERQRFNVPHLAEQASAFRPDAVVLSGWLNPAYRRLPEAAAAPGRRFIMAMDTPWRGTLKQRLAPWLLRGYLSRIDTVFVTGERCWQYAKRLGVPERRIRRGVYGVDHAALAPLFDARMSAGPWPRQFLFAGRYSPEKGIDLLMAAYADYRAAVADPWSLVLCGKGPLAAALVNQPGVTDLGFQQPAALRRLMIESGSFVLPSTFDPWPLALVEGCAAGLPVVASEACGSAVELIRDGFSGFTFATGDRAALAQTLLRVHNSAELPKMGCQARSFAEPYGTRAWADRWLAALA
jgi:glycosyltransferase involved in cell wall biosynthesis